MSKQQTLPCMLIYDYDDANDNQNYNTHRRQRSNGSNFAIARAIDVLLFSCVATTTGTTIDGQRSVREGITNKQTILRKPRTKKWYISSYPTRTGCRWLFKGVCSTTAHNVRQKQRRFCFNNLHPPGAPCGAKWNTQLLV
jgi:hypothetical protein